MLETVYHFLLHEVKYVHFLKSKKMSQLFIFTYTVYKIEFQLIINGDAL